MQIQEASEELSESVINAMIEELSDEVIEAIRADERDTIIEFMRLEENMYECGEDLALMIEECQHYEDEELH